MKNKRDYVATRRTNRRFLLLARWGAWMMAVGMLSLIGVVSVHAEPFLPHDDHQVLARVSTASTAIDGELRRMREMLRQDPGNLQLAVSLARRYLEIGRIEGDLRFAGYAQAVLNPWWDQSQPPAEVLLLRAIVRQRWHDFAGALEDLSSVLETHPYDTQAWLTRAVILEVLGDYREAMRSCLHVSRLSHTLAGTICTASVASLSGEAENSYRLLQRTLRESPQVEPTIRLWALSVLAEMALRLDYAEMAEAHFRQALALDRRNTAVLSAYADFLLDRSRPQEVLHLLEGRPLVDALLLRLALAEKQLGSPRLDAHIESLRARFAAARLRDQNVHLGSEARFTLYLLNKPGEALRLAQKNWSVQRTPADARLLLESALIQGDLQAAGPVLDWLALTGLEDSAITPLLKRTTERPS